MHKIPYNTGMSLVSNYIGGISSVGIGSSNPTQNLDLNDTTFSDLLEKQMGIQPKEESNIFGSLGMPAGMEIENIDFSDKLQPETEKINTENNSTIDLDTHDTTSSEAVTFFSSLLNNSNDIKSDLFDFAKKHASQIYNKCSQNVITDVKEFVEDIQELVS